MRMKSRVSLLEMYQVMFPAPAGQRGIYFQRSSRGPTVGRQASTRTG